MVDLDLESFFDRVNHELLMQRVGGKVKDRRKLRCILWRQWKRPRTRQRRLRRLGLSSEQAWKSAWNGRGPWWNAGASHMNRAMPKFRFDRMGLVSVLDTVLRLQRVP